LYWIACKRRPRLGFVGNKSFPFQMVADEFLNVGFVFNDQDARSGNHGHSLSKKADTSSEAPYLRRFHTFLILWVCSVLRQSYCFIDILYSIADIWESKLHLHGSAPIYERRCLDMPFTIQEERLQHESAKQFAFRVLRRNIMRLDMLPGEIIPEKHIAKR
jgi:hypothetical protein